MLIRILFILILIFVLVKIIFWILNYVRFSQKDRWEKSGPAKVNQMVKDPVCGIYVDIAEALSLNTGNGKQYFCSNKCRQRFLES